jgi:AP endonuclease 2
VVDDATLDSEGRCVILEFPAFVLIGTYSPANRDETRDDFRLGYLDALDARVRNLVAMGKRVVLTGDLNVIRDPIDTANLHERLRKDGMTVEDFFSTPSRRLFNQLVFGGNVRGDRDEGREDPVLWDLGRYFHPTRNGMFTCWDTKKNTRPANFGSRIDYVLCSDNMKDWFIDSNIQEGLMGSDHCPVFATIKDIVKVDANDVDIKDIMNPPGVFQDGRRLRDWTIKDLLPMSAKLIPEFDRRQSIKDMFFKKPAAKGASVPTLTKQASSASVSKEQTDPDPSSVTEPNDPLTYQSESIISAQSPAKSAAGLKRTPSSVGANSRPQKKSKGALAKEASGKGQSSLTGFFKPKATETPRKISEIEQEDDEGLPASGVDGTSEMILPKAIGENETFSAADNACGTPLPTTTPEKFIDPFKSRESWSKILGKRIAPKCEHGENCISLITKKAGANQGKFSTPSSLFWRRSTDLPPGRSFYICPRPLGPSGEKETGTEWRCGTFIWSSDWKGTPNG